jgi:hypothetical protein
MRLEVHLLQDLEITAALGDPLTIALRETLSQVLGCEIPYEESPKIRDQEEMPLANTE